MHVCPQELIAIVGAVPVLRWLWVQVVWWRAKRTLRKDHGWTYDARECRSCGEEVKR